MRREIYFVGLTTTKDGRLLVQVCFDSPTSESEEIELFDFTEIVDRHLQYLSEAEEDDRAAVLDALLDAAKKVAKDIPRPPK